MDVKTVKRWFWLRRTANKLRHRPKQTPEKFLAVLKDHKIDLVMDIGGNHGQTGEELREYGYNGRIVSFEPLPSAYAILSEKAKDDPKWEVAPRMAIGSENGTVMVHESEGSDFSSILPATGEMHAAYKRTNVVADVESDVRTLDAIFADYAKPGDNVFLKIDTQGYEKAVLDGARQILPSVKGIKIELSLFPLYEGETIYLELLQELHGMGFEPFMLTENSFSIDLRRQLQIDAVMFRT